ncbi:MAG: hypothetical protein ACM3N4_11020 [Nitrososphaerota archaeon]
MADQQDEQRERIRRQRERQFEIDRITFEYAEEYRQGRHPRIEAYMQRYPQYAAELLEYAVYFHTTGFEMETFEQPAELTMSPAAEKALARIREQSLAYPVVPATPAPIESLVKLGTAAGYTPPRLAEAVGLTPALLGRLEARAIAAASIPRALFQRLGEALKVAPEAIAAYLGAPQAGQAGGFYYADRPPAQQQESFLDAVQSSALSPERKREWAEIVSREASNGP